MNESDKTWEIQINRLEVQHYAGLSRTYGSYAVHLNGTAVNELQGFTCESHGMGDNSTAGVASHSRIQAGIYGMSTHFGKYVSMGYSTDTTHPAAPKMPGVLVSGTGERSVILVHPGHPPKLYLSSVGCFNLTGPLGVDQMMDFWDSGIRVIAVIDSLRQFRPRSFEREEETAIPGARVVVVGEPA